MLDENIKTLIKSECDRAGIDRYFVEAIIAKESSGKTWKSRYEPGFSYFEKPEFWAEKLNQSLDTEMAGQKTSYGLMQIMGGTARFLGFAGYLTELCLPDVNIHYGVMWFSKKFKCYTNYSDALAAYNAGSARRLGDKLENQGYVDSVLKIYREIMGGK